MIYPLNAVSQSVDIQIVDDSGLPVTGLLAATFPTLTWSLAGPNADNAFPALSDLALITTAYSSGGVKERGGGYYRLDLPNAIFTTAGEVKIRGEQTGKHVIAPWIDVSVTVDTVNTVVNTAPVNTAAIADKFLGRSLATGADGGHTVQDALRFLRNHWNRAGTTLTVYKEDGVTVAWTSTITVTPNTQPVTDSTG